MHLFAYIIVYKICVCFVDDLYLHGILHKIHEQKAHGGTVAIGRHGQQKCSVCNARRPYQTKHNEVSFSKVSTALLRLRVAQMPRSRDLAIFCAERQIDGQNQLLYPLLRMHVQDNYYYDVNNV